MILSIVDPRFKTASHKHSKKCTLSGTGCRKTLMMEGDAWVFAGRMAKYVTIPRLEHGVWVEVTIDSVMRMDLWQRCLRLKIWLKFEDILLVPRVPIAGHIFPIPFSFS